MAISPKAFDALVLLLENPGKLVERSMFRERLWSGMIVEDATMSRVIADLRKALGEDGRAWIETVPKFGYRLVAPVAGPAPPAPPPEKPETKPAIPAPAPKAMARPAYRVGIAAIIGILALAAFANLKFPDQKPKPRSILVLPFELIGPVPDAEILRLGVQDSLATELSGLSSLVVRTAPVDTPPDPNAAAETGKRYQASAVLLGSIQERGDKVHVSARLIDTSTGSALWADVQEASADNLFELEDLIAKRVSGALLPALPAEERANLSRYRPGNALAYKDYTIGRFHWNKRSQSGSRQALEMFRQASEADPGFALAYLGMADSYLFMDQSPLPQTERFILAKQALQKALSVNPQLGEAHATLGLLAESVDLDWHRADQEFRTAIRLSPSYATAHQWYGEFLSMMGQWKPSDAEFEKACELDPLSPIIRTDEAQMHYFRRDYPGSIAILQETLRLNPNFSLAHERIGWALMMMGKVAAARTEFDAAGSRGSALNGWDRAWAAALSGNKQAALEWLKAEDRDHSDPLDNAVIRTALGDQEGAVKALERAYEGRAAGVVSIKVNPAFDRLHSNPRFVALLSKMGLN